METQEKLSEAEILKNYRKFNKIQQNFRVVITHGVNYNKMKVTVSRKTDTGGNDPIYEAERENYDFETELPKLIKKVTEYVEGLQVKRQDELSTVVKNMTLNQEFIKSMK